MKAKKSIGHDDLCLNSDNSALETSLIYVWYVLIHCNLSRVPDGFRIFLQRLRDTRDYRQLGPKTAGNNSLRADRPLEISARVSLV